MRYILIFLVIVQICYLMYCFHSFEGFNISEVPKGPISNSQFSKMFEEIPLPASDELAEYGGRFTMAEGIQSPQMDASYYGVL